MSSVAEVAESKYVLLTTYRNDGTPVATPLWAVRDGNTLVMWTSAESWKVKRIGKNSQVLVQKCDSRGKKAEGPELAGTAEIFSGEESGDMIKRKYGIVGLMVVTGSRLRRGKDGTVGIRVRAAA